MKQNGVTLCSSELTPRFAKCLLRLFADKMVELSYIDFISHVAELEIKKSEHRALEGCTIQPNLIGISNYSVEQIEPNK